MRDYKLLKDLIHFNTVKDKENEKIINYIEEYLKKLGFKTEYKTKALVMSIGDDPKIGFLGHTDTVEYIEDFKEPFDLKQVDNHLYGLGVCDMKGAIAAMLETISEIDLSKIQGGIKLFFTYDEEINFGGIDEIVANDIKFPEYMIFGEPSNNIIYTGHKGLLWIDAIFNGLKAHSSTPEKGISANLNAVGFLHELEEFYNSNIKIDKEENYEVPYTTMNVGLINGGTAYNSIPASCKAGLDFRIAKKEHINALLSKLEELAKKYDATINVLDRIEPFIDEIDFLDGIKTTNFMTEAVRVKNSKRMILGLGPVTAHEVNEHITTESYEKLIEQYKELIEKICK